MRENTREIDQTHSYWYIPSAPRVNYSLLVMDSAGMMKMATGDGFPLWQGAGKGSREVFGGYRGLRRRNSRSIFCSGSFRVRRYIWVQGVRRWTSGVLTRQGACLGGRPPPSWAARISPDMHSKFPRLLSFQKLLLQLISFRFDSV